MSKLSRTRNKNYSNELQKPKNKEKKDNIDIKIKTSHITNLIKTNNNIIISYKAQQTNRNFNIYNKKIDLSKKNILNQKLTEGKSLIKKKEKSFNDLKKTTKMENKSHKNINDCKFKRELIRKINKEDDFVDCGNLIENGKIKMKAKQNNQIFIKKNKKIFL